MEDGSSERNAVLEPLRQLGASTALHDTVVAVLESVVAGASSGVIDESTLGIVITDLERTIVYANPAARKMFGIEDFRGVNLFDIFESSESQEVLEEQLRLRRAGLIGNFTLRAAPVVKLEGSRRHTNRAPIDVDITALPIRHGAGEVAGSLAIIRDLTQQRLVGAIHELNRRSEAHGALLSGLADLLKPIIPFQAMIVSRYSADLRHANSFFIFGRRGDRNMQKRWILLDEMHKSWLQSPAAKTEDLERLTGEAGPFRAMRDDVLIKGLLSDKLTQLIRRPIRRGDRLKGACTLFFASSTSVGSDLERLVDDLPIDATVLRALELIDEQIVSRKLDIVRKLNRCVTIETACQTLASELIGAFGWDHVSLFRVDRASRQLVMVAQDVNPSALSHIRLPASYTQSLDEGLLGDCAANGELINSDHVAADERYKDVPESGDVGSELCCPVFFGYADAGLRALADRRPKSPVRFVINVEDERQGRFSSDECASLAELAAEIGSVLERISQLHFLTQCFEHSSEPTIATDVRFDIRKANRAAAALFGLDEAKDVVGNLARFAADETAERRLKSDDVEIGEVQVRQVGYLTDVGEPPILPVYVSRQRFRESLDGFIFVMRDVRNIRRTLELELFQKAAYEVAVETNAPLTHAIAKLESFAGLATSTESGLDVNVVLRQLARVKRSYLRLAMFNTQSRGPSAPLQVLNLKSELDAFLFELDEEVQAKIEFDDQCEMPRMVGDHFQIGVAIEALISKMLICAPESGKVDVAMWNTQGRLMLEITGFTSQSWASAHPSVAARTSREELFVATPLIEQFVAASHGTLAHEMLPDGRESYVLSFPILTS